VPQIKVSDRRKINASSEGNGGPDAEPQTDGEDIKVVDVRLDYVREKAVEGDIDATLESANSEEWTVGSVLVLP